MQFFIISSIFPIYWAKDTLIISLKNCPKSEINFIYSSFWPFLSYLIHWIKDSLIISRKNPKFLLMIRVPLMQFFIISSFFLKKDDETDKKLDGGGLPSPSYSPKCSFCPFSGALAGPWLNVEADFEIR